MRYLVDTNILIRWTEADDPEHGACVEAVDSLLAEGMDVCVCAQVLVEFWVVSTRPAAANGLGLTPEETHRRVRDFRKTFGALPEPANIAEKWLDLVTTNRVIGKQAHDARLVALMLAHDVAHLLTLNPSDFTRYQAITPVTPDEILHPETT